MDRKTAKRLLAGNFGPGSNQNNDKLLQALLQLPNTPTADCNLSPAEIAFGRPLRDAFSFVKRLENLYPYIRKTWRETWKAKETALYAQNDGKTK